MNKNFGIRQVIGYSGNRAYFATWLKVLNYVFRTHTHIHPLNDLKFDFQQHTLLCRYFDSNTNVCTNACHWLCDFDIVSNNLDTDGMKWLRCFNHLKYQKGCFFRFISFSLGLETFYINTWFVFCISIIDEIIRTTFLLRDVLH